MLVTIMGGDRIHGPTYDEYFNVTASVQKVYKMRGQRRPRGFVNFLVCDLPDEMLRNGRPRRRTRLLIMGNFSKEYGLVIDGNGYLEKRGKDSRMKGRSC